MKMRLIAVLMVAALLVTACEKSQKGSIGEVVITWPSIWVGQDSKAPAVASLVEEFNQNNPGVTVEIEDQPSYDGYREKIRTSISAGIVPDFFTINPSPTSLIYYDSDLILDFKGVMDEEWRKSYNEGTLSQATHKGMLKSLPYEVAITPIWYNASLLSKAGVEIPETWDDLLIAAEELKRAGIVPTSQMTGGGNAWTSMLWYSHLLASLGGPGVWDKPLTDPVYVEAAEKLLVLFSDGNTTVDAVGGNPAVSGGHFLAEETAIFINGPWYIGRVREDAPQVYQEIVVGPAPAAGNNTGAMIGFLQTNLAAADLRESDPAKAEALVAFAQWLSQPEHVAGLSKSAGSMFAIRFDSSDIDDPLQKMFIDVANNASFTIPHMAGVHKEEVSKEFGQALGMMALGDATPEEFVKMLIKSNQ